MAREKQLDETRSDTGTRSRYPGERDSGSGNSGDFISEFAPVLGPALAPGDTLGRYQITGRLGQGGMGIVYAAHDRDLRRAVALKILPQNIAEANRKDRALLLSEARTMAMLSHPHVVTVYDVGTVDGRDYIAMECIDGPSLRHWLTGQDDEGPPPAHILDAFVQAGRGLAAAHTRGIVHGDFKPSNVLIGSDGRVRVTDFGLARPMRGLTGSRQPLNEPGKSDEGPSPQEAVFDTHTFSNVCMGTPAYMAAERFIGHTVDARSDQFSFCVALYEALYHAPPFPGQTIEELQASVSAGIITAPVHDSRLSQRLYRIIARGLQVSPDARYPSMEELLAEVELEIGAARPGTLLTRPQGQRSKRHKWRRAARPALLACLGLVALTLALALSFTTGGTSDSDRQRPQSNDGNGDNYDKRLALPEDAESRGRIATLRDLLAQAPHLRDRHDAARGLELVAQVTAEARAIPHPPLAAEALYWKALFQAQSKDTTEAWQTAEETLALAEELGYAHLRARILVGMFGLAGYASSDLTLVRRLARRAASAVAEAPSDEALAAELALYRGLLLLREGKFADSRGAANRALTTFERLGELQSVEARRLMAGIDLVEGKFDTAINAAQHSLRELEHALGPDHDRVAVQLVRAAFYWRPLGHYDRAYEYTRRSVDMRASKISTESGSVRGGHSVRGWVVDETGAPVAGAEVVGGRQLAADGKYLLVNWDINNQGDVRLRRTTSDAAGAFILRDIPEDGGYQIMAEHPRAGRTPAGLVLESLDERDGLGAESHGDSGRLPETSKTPVTLSLRRFGTLSGTVTAPYADANMVAVVAYPRHTSRGAYALRFGPKGPYSFERLPHGQYALFIILASNRHQTQIAAWRDVRITADQPTTLDVHVSRGSATLEVSLRRADHLPIPAASVSVFSGSLITETYVGEFLVIMRRAARNGSWQAIRAATIGNQNTVALTGLSPGHHTLCIEQLPFDPRDPALQRLQARMRPSDRYYCEPIEIPAANAVVRHSVVLP